MARGKLTPKRARFAHHYASIIPPNGAEAARRTGYTAKHAKVIANRLLKIPSVKAEVKRLVEANIDRVNESLRQAEAARVQAHA